MAGEPDDLGGVPERIGGGRVARIVHRVGETLELAGQARSIAVVRRGRPAVAAAQRANQNRTQHPARTSPHNPSPSVEQAQGRCYITKYGGRM